MGCETGKEMKTLKATVQDKLGENFKVTESSQMKPKIKIINVSEEEMRLDDDDLITTIKKQNRIDAINDGFQMRIVKKIVKEKRNDNNQLRRKEKEEEHQSGFRKQYSCETAIQTVIDEWKLIVSETKMVGVIFMDLKRAFETIDRERLLEKLYQYGIRGMVIEWLRSYLKDRTQQVQFNNKWSKLMTTEYGVPQGS
ncbi:uncharacterized protein, partial [Polyergus mexicanus]|uniref:uncharacterized protein n=1 Tax=Polyergus mexicanus TaxID=615972 RepID=UPI0038B64AB2